MKNTKTNGKISKTALFAAKYLPASMAMALFAGCLNPANEADETTAAKSNAPLVPYGIEETTPATPKQAQKAEGFQVPVAPVYYFANAGEKKLFKLGNPKFKANSVEYNSGRKSYDDEDFSNITLDTLTGRIIELDSILVYTEMQGANLQEEISNMQNKTGQAFSDALNKFVEDYTLEYDGSRKPKVIYRLTLSNRLNYWAGIHVRFADVLDVDTIAIASDKSNATYVIKNGDYDARTYPKLENTDQLDHMRVLGIVGGKTPATSVLENPRVVPNNNPRNNLYKTTGTRDR